MDLKSLKTSALKELETLKKTSSKGVRLSVLGDMAVDRFVFGNVDRISPEAPVPVLLVDRLEDKAGCAANVVRNLSALNADFQVETHLLGVVGTDEGSLLLKNILQQSCQGLVMHLCEQKQWVTPIKTRYIAGSQHQLLRVDQEDAEWSKKKPLDFPKDWESHIAQSKVLICQDYAKGLLRENFLAEAIRCSRDKGVAVLVDPNRNTPSSWYSGATLLTPNIDEAEKLWGHSLERGAREELVLEAAEHICRKLSLDSILITRGKHGMTGYVKGASHFSFPSFAQEVFDVTGAGDTVIAVLGLFLSLGLDFKHAAYLSNAAASVVVSKVGTAVATCDEIQRVILKL